MNCVTDPNHTKNALSQETFSSTNQKTRIFLSTFGVAHLSTKIQLCVWSPTCKGYTVARHGDLCTIGQSSLKHHTIRRTANYVTKELTSGF
jgi:hypothetical protein